MSALVLVLALCCISSVESIAQSGRWIHIDSAWAFIYRGVACADSIHCVVIGDSAGLISRVRRTTDGGRSWRNILGDTITFPTKLTKRTFRTIAHPRPGVFIVVCDSGTLLRSYNDGASWDTTRLAVGGSVAFDIPMQGEHGYLSAAPRFVFRTDDAGMSWNPIDIVRPDSLSDLVIQSMWMIDPESVVLRLSSRKKGTYLARSTDGGDTWEFIQAPQLDNCLAISFPDRMHGWAAGGERTGVGDLEKDIIAATTDGGYTWEYQVYKTIPQAFGLREIAFVDNRHGIAVGGNGKVLHTSDGGFQWTQLETGFDTNDISNLSYLAFPARGYAYTVSTNFIVLAYREQPSGVPSSLTEQSVVISPNPARSATVRIMMPAPPAEGVHIEIIDMLGSVVARLDRSSVDSAGRGVFLWDTGSSPKGLYFVRASGDPGRTAIPILVE